MKYISTKQSLFFTTRTAFVKHFIAGKKLKILDVGNLGEGPVNVDIRKTIEDNGGQYFGLDVNKNLADKLGFKNQLIGDLHDLKDIENKSFDCIYAGEIIEHTWYPAKMIKECYRVLKDDGFLLLSTPNIFDLTNVLRIYLFKKDTVGFNVDNLAYQESKDNFKNWREKEKQVLSQPQHKIIFSPAMMFQLLNMHKFKVDNLVFVGKARNFLHALFLKIFPQASQQINIVASKASLEEIFSIKK